MPTQFIFRTQTVILSYLLRRFVYYGTTCCCYIRLLANMVSLTTEQASPQTSALHQIFNRTFTSDTGKPFMICTRCDHMPEKDRGTYYKVSQSHMNSI